MFSVKVNLAVPASSANLRQTWFLTHFNLGWKYWNYHTECSRAIGLLRALAPLHI